MTDPRIDKLNADPNFNSNTGVTITEWKDGTATIAIIPSEAHLNPAGLIHGGVMMTALDAVMAMTGSYSEPPLDLVPGLTLNLNTNFISAIRVEDGELTATARKTGGGKSIFFAEGEVRTADGRLVASATGVFKPSRRNE